MAVEPTLLETVRKAGKKLVKLADHLDKLFADTADAVLKKPTEAEAPKTRTNGAAKEMPTEQAGLQ
jgi:hypothetical protein